MPGAMVQSTRLRGLSIALDGDKLSNLEIDSLIADDWAEPEVPLKKPVAMDEELLTPDWMNRERGMSFGMSFDLFCLQDGSSSAPAASTASPIASGSSSTCSGSETTDCEHDFEQDLGVKRVIGEGEAAANKRKRSDSMSRILAITSSDSDGDSSFTDSLDELDGIEDLSADAQAAGYSSLPFLSMLPVKPELAEHSTAAHLQQPQTFNSGLEQLAAVANTQQTLSKPEPVAAHSSSSSSTNSSSTSGGAVTRAAVQLIELPTLKPRDGQHRIGAYTAAERAVRIARFHSKRQHRVWHKAVKYNVRKDLADQRPRVKGRFVSSKGDAPPCANGFAAAPVASAAAAPAPAVRVCRHSGCSTTACSGQHLCGRHYYQQQHQLHQQQLLLQQQQQQQYSSYHLKTEPRAAPASCSEMASAEQQQQQPEEPVRMGRGARSAGRKRTSYAIALQ